MAKYTISDIHGNYNLLLKMMKLINFSEEDILYVIGDIIDRGPESLAVYEYIRRHKNIKMIKGNHEQLAEDGLDTLDTYNWFGNGGQQTYYELLTQNCIAYNYMDRFTEWCKSLPYYIIDGDKILVHAGIKIFEEATSVEELMAMQTPKDMLWERNKNAQNERFENYTVICGHTRTAKIEASSKGKIIKGDSVIYIDCGANSYGTLGCLNLDTLEEYYVGRQYSE